MVTVKTNNPYHHHSNLYLFPVLFFSLSVSNLLTLSLPLYFYIFVIILSISSTAIMQKNSKFLICRSFSLNKERNITTKPVVSVCFIHFSFLFLSSCQIYQNLPFLHTHTHTHTHTHIYIFFPSLSSVF